MANPKTDLKRLKRALRELVVDWRRQHHEDSAPNDFEYCANCLEEILDDLDDD